MAPHRRSTIRKAICSMLLLVCSASTAHGSGYGVFTQGASALGQADAVVAHPDGPSGLYFNPALMSRVPGTQAEIGTTLLFPSRHYSAPDGYAANTHDTVFTPSTFYLSHAITDSFSAGLGLFNPFGLGTDWGGEWGGAFGGRYIATKSELTAWNINPAVAYRIVPTLTVAAGLDIVLLDATLENKRPSIDYLIPLPAFDVSQKFNGSGTGVGYNFGLYLELPLDLSFGASYRSLVNVDIDGDFTAAISPLSFKGKTTVKLPQQVTAGVAYRPSESLSLEAGMRWEDWSCFKQLYIQLTGLPAANYSRDWHSTFAFNIGGKYRINETFSLMGGYLHGWNPVPDSTFEPAIPDSDTNLYTLGGEARFSSVTVALAYGFQSQTDRFKGFNLYGGAGMGEYSTYLHMVGLSIGYAF